MKPNKVITSTEIYSSIGKCYTLNLCFDGSYYFTLDGIKADWSFPSVSKDSAFWHYKNICEDQGEIDYFIEWVLHGE